MSTYILHVESGLRLARFDDFDFERECKAIATMMHEQKGRNAAPATYTFKLMKAGGAAVDLYTGKSAQFLVKPRIKLQAVSVPRGEGEQ